MTALTTMEIRGADGAPRARMPRLRLRVIAGPDQGRAFAADRDRVVVGTQDGADLVLSDKTVSRFHCELALTGDRVRVRDLGSRNGTTVDGVAIVEAFLHPGAKLTIGGTTLVFEVDAPGDVQVPLSTGDRFGGLVGGSLAMRAVFARLERAAGGDATVLLEGESGTGKELAAEAIHAASARRGGPFVVVDCGAIPAALAESELFGHDRGAFTGAHADRAGSFVAAHGGTLFLDEIGELPLDLQPKLLRALERREVKPLGRTAYTPVDVRVIAATNRDLRAEVNAKRFRADLFYRLAVVDVRLPPLRERREDLPSLAEHLLGRPPEPELLASLTAHPWPGNVRELRNHLDRYVALGTIDAPAAGSDGEAGSHRAAKQSWERTYLEELLARHGGNVSAAARGAGIDRKQLYKMLWRNGLR